MKYDPEIHHRRSIRLKNYDYSREGFYFITIVSHNREYLFGEIVNDEMVLNDAGMMIEQIWKEIPVYYKGFNIHQFTVMPNHIHGIIEIVGAGPCACPGLGKRREIALTENGQPQGVAPTGLGDIVHRYKTLTTKRYIDGVRNKNWQRFNQKLWQRNYWEHIIRNDNEHQRIAEYILDNPKRWSLDKFNIGMGNQVMEQPWAYTTLDEEWEA